MEKFYNRILQDQMQAFAPSRTVPHFVQRYIIIFHLYVKHTTIFLYLSTKNNSKFVIILKNEERKINSRFHGILFAYL